MADWDASTIASVTALIVAVIALLIAFAQALQQYFITGQLIRICDSVVFGPMPGQGRRVWQFSQFRFRVLYSVPQISLSTDLWPSGSGYHVKSYAIGRHPLPRLAVPDGDIFKTTSGIVQVERRREWKAKAGAFLSGLTPWRRELSAEEGHGGLDVVMRHLEVAPPSKQRRTVCIAWPGLFRRRLFSASWWSSLATNRSARTSYTSSSDARSDTEIVASRVGEASWVSFCRAIEVPCGNSVRLDHIQYDADRCPPDLVSAPMQVSMRDVIVMGLMAGMEITSASFDDKSVAMQGAAGTITSSKHAVLGPILHFTPRNTDESPAYVFGYRFGIVRGFVDSYWLARTWDVCCVAYVFFNWTTRRTARRLDERWIRDQDNSTLDVSDDSTDYGEGRYSGRNYYSTGHRERDYSGRNYFSRASKTKAWTRDIIKRHRKEEKIGGRQRKRPGAEGEETNGKGKEVIRVGSAIPGRLPQDGMWTIDSPPISQTRQAASSTVDQQGDTNKPGREAEASAAGKVVKTPGEARTTLGLLGSPSQADAASEENLRPPKPRRWATVEDVSDYEGESQSNGPSPEAEDKPEAQVLPFGAETTAEAAFRELPEKPTPTPPVASRRATAEDENGAREAKEIYAAKEERIENAELGDDKELSERVQTAKKLQAARADKLRQVQRDKEIVEDSVKRGVMRSPYDEAAGRTPRLLLTNYEHNAEEAGRGSSRDATKEDGEDGDDGNEELTEEAQEARERELARERERREREGARDQRNRARNRASMLKFVDLYWLSQMDIMRGYWATPWHDPNITPLYPALTGCVTVVLEALLGFLGSENIVYAGQNLDTIRSFYVTAVWMFEQRFDDGEGLECRYNHTYPAYAQNARGGVIASGHYKGCRVASFPSHMVPILELAHSYEWQVYNNPRDQTTVEEQNVELMRIDSWLSYVGRLNEISDGPHRLLRQTPALVQLLMEEFEIDFQNIDLSAKDGGLQDIQGLAANVMDFLTDEELTEAEQLYILVALLRSVKVAQCTLSGSDTTNLDGILKRDVQAHLV